MVMANVIDIDGSIEKYGWVIHLVPCDDPQSPTGYNCHTHGFLESKGHKDIYITIPIFPQHIVEILWNIADQIDNGEEFVPGIRYERICQDYEVTFSEDKESGRDVLRMDIPGLEV